MKNLFERYKYWLIAMASFLAIIIFLAILQATVPFKKVVASVPEAQYLPNNSFIWEDSDIKNDYLNNKNQNRYKYFDKKEINLKSGKYTLKTKTNVEVLVQKKDIAKPQIQYCMQREIYNSYDITSLYKGMDFVLDGNTIQMNDMGLKGRFSEYQMSSIVYNALQPKEIPRISGAQRRMVIITTPLDMDIEVEVLQEEDSIVM